MYNIKADAMFLLSNFTPHPQHPGLSWINILAPVKNPTFLISPQNVRTDLKVIKNDFFFLDKFVSQGLTNSDDFFLPVFQTPEIPGNKK